MSAPAPTAVAPNEQPAGIIVPGITCCRCGSPEIVALKPGSDALYEEIRGLSGKPVGRLLVAKATADEALCAEHWPWRTGGPRA